MAVQSSVFERGQIAALLKDGKSQRYIADKLESFFGEHPFYH
jgi:hypothetical protein